MAAALLALVALPALAAPGSINQPGLGGTTDESLVVSVHALTAAGEVDTVVANTKVGRNTYVSNLAPKPAANDPDATPAVVAGTDENPANKVTVAYTPAAGRDDGGSDQSALATDAAAARADGATLVRVKASSGHSITLPWIGAGADEILGGTGAADDTTSLTFTVVRRGGAQPKPGELATLDGDTITLTIGTVEARLVVDGARPTITNIMPASGKLQGGSSVTIGFTVTDTGSGLRTDREDGTGAGDTADLNDNDGNSAEPYSTGNGGAVDIDVEWDGAMNHERRGGLNWEEETRDKSYSTSYIVGGLGSGDYDWSIWAKDRVGNEYTTDAKPSTTKQDDFRVTVDKDAPDASQQVYAGIGYDSSKKTEKQDASSILLIFTNGRGGSLDQLNGSTISASDFTVEDNTVTGVTHPNNKSSVDKNEELTAGSTVTVKEGSVLVDEEISSDDLLDTDPDGTDDMRVRTGGTDASPTYADPAADHTLAVGDIVENLSADLAAKANDDDVCDSDKGLVTDEGDRMFTAPTTCVDTRSRVYLKLGTPLGNDEKPAVNIVGEVEDKAGNRNTVRSLGDAKDRIPPTLTVTIEGDVDVSGRPLAQEDITVNVSAGETLAANPFVWLVAFDENGTVTGTPDGGAARTSGNGWTITFSEEDTTRVAAVLVFGEDVSGAGNKSMTSGWKTDDGAIPSGAKLDLVKLMKAGNIVEFDGVIAPASATIDPDSDTDATTLATESVNPFITLTFTEGNENDIVIPDDEDTDADESATHTEFEKDNNTVKFDAYSTVSVTNVMIDGNAVDDRAVAVLNSAGTEISVSLTGLSVGDHTLTYTATDVAGNSVTGSDTEVDFEVLPRKAYKVGLRPGWNLVSLPANPSDTMLDSVLPSGHPAQTVLSYQNGEWVSASRDAESGMWAGTLTDMTAGYGYFVQTTGFEDLATAIPESDPTTLLPTVSVVQGWNLLGVVDAGQAKAGKNVNDADAYFSSIEWRVAYSFNAQTTRWDKITKGADTDSAMEGTQLAQVTAGTGYWVWVTKAGTLVP